MPGSECQCQMGCSTNTACQIECQLSCQNARVYVRYARRLVRLCVRFSQDHSKVIDVFWCRCLASHGQLRLPDQHGPRMASDSWHGCERWRDLPSKNGFATVWTYGTRKFEFSKLQFQLFGVCPFPDSYRNRSKIFPFSVEVAHYFPFHRHIRLSGCAIDVHHQLEV